MSYTLYGSLTSPFVRRIRMVMERIPHEFKEIDIFASPGAAALKAINPVNQIPVLMDGDRAIWDSRIIFNYLNHMHKLQNLDWEDENLLTAMEGGMDAAVSLLLMGRSGIDTGSGDFMYVKRHRERIESVLDHLRPYLSGEGQKTWDFHSATAYCFLDWASFRGLVKLDSRPDCQSFLAAHASRSIVTSTQIPRP